MATDTALAVATLAIRHILEHAIDAASGLNADVVSNRPDKLSAMGKPTVNVYLYQTQLNPFMRNDDLQPQVVVDKETGMAQTTRRWITPLNLHYLISFHGDDQLLEPQRLMAVSVAALHRMPVIEPGTLAAIAQANFPKTPAYQPSDYEPVQVQMITESLSDMLRLWTSLSAPYALSTFYELRTALVQSDPDRASVRTVTEIDVRAMLDPKLRDAPEVFIAKGEDTAD